MKPDRAYEGVSPVWLSKCQKFAPHLTHSRLAIHVICFLPEPRRWMPFTRVPLGCKIVARKACHPHPPPCSPCPVRLTLQSTTSAPRVKIKPAQWSHQNDGRSTLEAVKPKLCLCYFCYCHIRILHQDREENRKISSVSHGETHHLNTHELCAWPSMSWPPL